MECEHALSDIIQMNVGIKELASNKLRTACGNQFNEPSYLRQQEVIFTHKNGAAKYKDRLSPNS